MSALVKWPANVFIWKVKVKVVFLLNNKVILCWGKQTWTQSQQSHKTIILPITYTTPCTIGTALLGNNAPFVGHRHSTPTINSFLVSWYGNTGNDNISGISYIAIGY